MLTINKLNFSYPGKAALLREISLHFKDGHIYGLLGKNGAGKSTLLKNFVGLASPSSGNCMYNGEAVFKRSVSVLEDIYFIPEEIFVPALTPAKFVANTAGFYPKFSREDFYRYMKALDVDHNGIMNKQSHGQQKKAMIAFGLASNTNLLVMDEPTNGLDIPSKVQFRKLIASVQAESRCIIISTHQVRDMDSLIDTLLVLHDGGIILNKTVDEVTEKLYFSVYDETAGLPVLYEEEHIRGRYAILKNTKGLFSKPDLELLFNGITGGSPSLLPALNDEIRK